MGNIDISNRPSAMDGPVSSNKVEAESDSGNQGIILEHAPPPEALELKSRKIPLEWKEANVEEAPKPIKFREFLG